MEATQLLSAVLLAGGCFFALTGSIGIVRMPDFYTRVHPAGKSDTLAQFLILMGLVAQSEDPMVMAKLALLTALLFVTSPTATHAVTKAAYLDGLKPLVAPSSMPTDTSPAKRAEDE